MMATTDTFHDRFQNAKVTNTTFTHGQNGRPIRQNRISILVARLSSIEILKPIPKNELNAVAKLCEWRSYAKGQSILFQEDSSRDVFFLCSGSAQATIYSPNGKFVGFEQLGEGAIFGEMAAIDGQPRSTEVGATAECTVAFMRPNDFLELLRRYPDVSINVTKRLSATVRFLCERVFEYCALVVNDRIEAELLRIAEPYQDDGCSISIPKPPTHASIASRVNTHREAVTKHLNYLDRVGLIQRHKRALTIPDIEKIRHRVRRAINAE